MEFPAIKKLDNHVSAEAVQWVLDHLYVPTQDGPSNSNVAHAAYYGVDLQTIKAWRRKGLHMGMWRNPTKERWQEAKDQARAYIQGKAHHINPPTWV